MHDSKGAVPFLRELIEDVRGRVGRQVVLEFRMDGAFFQQPIFDLLEAKRTLYAIKVPFFRWLGLVPLIRAQQQWHPLKGAMGFFEQSLDVPAWNRTLRVVIYRKPVPHESRKNYQLDLFDPDNGHFEYSAVTTNTDLAPAALWDFMAGRGAQEKTFAELKGEFALDVVPTNHYGANSAWQQISILAHNLMRSFQLQTLSTPKPRSRKRTYAYTLRSMRTLRFLLIARAGRLARIGGQQVVQMTCNPTTQILYDRISHVLGT